MEVSVRTCFYKNFHTSLWPGAKPRSVRAGLYKRLPWFTAIQEDFLYKILEIYRNRK